jgi:serine/threonine protein kinase
MAMPAPPLLAVAKRIGDSEADPPFILGLLRDEYDVGPVFEIGRSDTSIRTAVQRSTSRKVALKIVPTPDPRTRERALQDGAILQMPGLRHDHIIECYAVYESRQQVILVCEYCSGGDLRTRLNRCGSFTEDTARPVFRQIVTGLAACIKAGVCHRDIKPDNIFIHVDAATGKETIKLGDFGLARPFTPGQNYGAARGTVRYAAPEVYQCGGYNGELADVWSAGVVLYALLTGKLPFYAKSDLEQMLIIEAGKYHMPTGWSLPLQSLISAMLCRDPSRRPAFRVILRHPWLRDNNINNNGNTNWQTVTGRRRGRSSAMKNFYGATLLLM